MCVLCGTTSVYVSCDMMYLCISEGLEGGYWWQEVIILTTLISFTGSVTGGGTQSDNISVENMTSMNNNRELGK